MSNELAIRFNRAELLLISSALAVCPDDESRNLALEIYRALNPEAKQIAPAAAPEPQPTTEAEPPAQATEEDFVVRVGPEQAVFSDGSIVLRQRMSLHPIFGKLRSDIMQPDLFRVIFSPESTISQCEQRLKNPPAIDADGDPGDPKARLRGQLHKNEGF